MLIFVAGIPKHLFNQVQAKFKNIFGEGHQILAHPESPRPDGKYVPSKDSAKILIERWADNFEEYSKQTGHGCGVLVMRSPGVPVTDFLRSFYPFAVSVVVDLPILTIVSGTLGKQTGNLMCAAMRAQVSSFFGAIKAMKVELAARSKRTPLALPLRNFRSNVLAREVDRLFNCLANSDDPAALIHLACQRIEAVHPFTKLNGNSFYDESGWRFKMPGRALHGRKGGVDEGHFAQCLANAKLRLGGPILEGFHYDTTKGENDRLSGNLPDCHDTVRTMRGHPHLNIYPNDFAR